MIGREVFGYRVEELIGKGSFASVYKVKKENESGHITSDQYDILKTWHEDPWAWGKKFNS